VEVDLNPDDPDAAVNAEGEDERGALETLIRGPPR
jgi:hypothetical protein